MCALENNNAEDNEEFLKKAKAQFEELFSNAKEKDELHFALSLAPEFRPYAVNTALDAQKAFEEYVGYIQESEASPLRIRISLALYCHLAEASGFWEIPKNLLSIVEGNKYNLVPFLDLVKKYGSPEGSIAPSSNKVMRSLMKYSQVLGYQELAEVFRDAFDADLRNGFAHADYAILDNGVCVGPRYNKERVIEWGEYHILLNRAVNFYTIFMEVLENNLSYYSEPKIVKGHLNDKEPESTWEIHYSKESGYVIEGGVGYEPKQP